ncbi:hypothetical protein ACFLXE_08660 [Chloroflexota bacterium]
MNRIYVILRLYMNFFQPLMKLVHKTKNGATVHKVYGRAQTPYQRLLRWGIMSDAKRSELAAIYAGLNPILLLSRLNENLESLWKLADRPTPRRGKSTEHYTSVTPHYDAMTYSSVTVLFDVTRRKR